MLSLLFGMSGVRFVVIGCLSEDGDKVLGTECLIVVFVLRFVVDVSFVVGMLVVCGVGGKPGVSMPVGGVMCGGVEWWLKSLCVC